MTDAKKLEEAIAFYKENELHWARPQITEALVRAAEAHLSALPRTKEVEIVGWAVLDADGIYRSIWKGEEYARGEAWTYGDQSQVIRLTGTATVKA
jgi:hypothetical protein